MRIINNVANLALALVVCSCFSNCAKTAIDMPELGGAIETGFVTTDQTQVTTAAAIYTTTYVIQPTQWYVDGQNFLPGSVISIPAGSRGSLLLKNFRGATDKPIIIVNKGGKVNITAMAGAAYAFKTQNCQNFKILGNGVSTLQYGITVTGGNISVTMDSFSSDFEISNLEVRNSAFAGIMAKTDPTCDPATWRGHFTMKNVLLHDNYIHHTGGEGFYVGNSYYAKGEALACGTVLPHDVRNVKIYNNRVEHTGCEGIQVGSAIADCAIYNNVVQFPGVSPFASGQNNGIQIGEGTGGKCYNNIIRSAPGNGIIVLGLGDNTIANNVILNSGAYGIFADSRYTPGPYFRFINNTITNSVLGGIKLNSTTIPMNIVINNAITGPRTSIPIIKISPAVKLTASNNYTTTSVNLLMLVAYATNDYHLLPTSPLINAGANVSVYGVTSDLYGTSRPSAGAYDIGATEFK